MHYGLWINSVQQEFCFSFLDEAVTWLVMQCVTRDEFLVCLLCAIGPRHAVTEKKHLEHFMKISQTLSLSIWFWLGYVLLLALWMTAKEEPDTQGEYQVLSLFLYAFTLK